MTVLDDAAEFVNRRMDAGSGIEPGTAEAGQIIDAMEDETPGDVSIRMQRALLADLVPLEDLGPLVVSIAEQASFLHDEGHTMSCPAHRSTLGVALAQEFAVGYYVGRHSTPAVAASVLVPRLEAIATADHPREAALELLAEIGRGLR